jgi:hypothetical protein
LNRRDVDCLGRDAFFFRGWSQKERCKTRRARKKRAPPVAVFFYLSKVYHTTR